jgi:pumilio family protein 6
MEVLFLTFPPKSTSILKLEFYGPQLTLFHTGEYSSGTIPLTQISLSSILQKESETTQQSVLKFFHERVIVKGSEKKLYSFSFYQQLLWEYVAFVSLKMDIRTLSMTLCDHSLTLLSTRAGAKVVAECIAYGTPKERKRIIKSLKGFVRSSVLHSDAYIAILRLLDVTDDTVLIQKSILGELIVASSKDKTTTKKQKIAAATVVDEEGNEDEKEETIELKQEEEEEDEAADPEKSVESPLLEIALSESGCKVLLLLLAKTDEERKRYLDPWNLAMLHANPSVVEDGKEIPTSKKNHETRRTELLEYLKPSLIQLCQQHAAVLLPSKFGSRVQRAVYETWSSEILADAIVAACDEPLDDTHVANIFEHPFGHLVIKNLLLFESEAVGVGMKDEENSTRTDLHPLASKLHQKYKGQLRKAIASSNRGAFVLAALAAFPDATGKEVRKELKKNEKEISALLRGKDESQSSTAGYEALLKALS